MSARESRRLRVIRAKERASSPTSSGELASIGCSRLPWATTAIAARSSLIGRARLRAISHAATSPATTATRKMAMSARCSLRTIAATPANAPETLVSRVRR